jgi:hypothetical protein
MNILIIFILIIIAIYLYVKYNSNTKIIGGKTDKNTSSDFTKLLNLNKNMPDFDMSKIKMPDFDMSKIKMPDFDMSKIKMPDFNTTTAPTVAPTIAQTVAPTIAQTVAPTIAPTVASTVIQTSVPTNTKQYIMPTQEPINISNPLYNSSSKKYIIPTQEAINITQTITKIPQQQTSINTTQKYIIPTQEPITIKHKLQITTTNAPKIEPQTISSNIHENLKPINNDDEKNGYTLMSGWETPIKKNPICIKDPHMNCPPCDIKNKNIKNYLNINKNKNKKKSTHNTKPLSDELLKNRYYNDWNSESFGDIPKCLKCPPCHDDFGIYTSLWKK